MIHYKNFKSEYEVNITKQGFDQSLLNARNAFFNESFAHDSNSTYDHVLADLKAYAQLTSYCVVFYTIVEYMSKAIFPDRTWGLGDNIKKAVWEFFKTHSEFEIDKRIDRKLMTSVAPSGYLKRTRQG